MQPVQRQPRRPNDQTFRKTDVVRLIKCARREGLSKFHIEIKRDGLTLIVDNTPTNATSDKNEWDEPNQCPASS